MLARHTRLQRHCYDSVACQPVPKVYYVPAVRSSVTSNLHALVTAILFVAIAPYDLCSGAQRSPDGELHARRAQAAIASNRPDIASTELQALIRLEPNDINAHASLGMVLFTQGHYDQAAKNFESALALSPSLWNAKAFLGMCQIRLGRADQGRSDIEVALPRVTDKRLRGQAGLELVKSYADAGEEDKAARTIEALQHNDPDNPDLLFAAYRIHSALASAALQRLSQTSPDSARIHQVLGDEMFLQENFQGAISEYRQALGIDPRLSGVHLRLGQALLAQGGAERTSTAETEFQAELAIDRANPDALFQLGQIAYERGNESDATQFFKESLACRPSFPDAHIALAKILSEHSRDAEAVENLEAALKTEPSNRTAHYRLAQLYNKSGKRAEAAREFDIARKLEAVEDRKTPVARYSISGP